VVCYLSAAYRSMRRFWKISKWTILFLLLLSGSVVIGIRVPAVQTWLAQRAADYLTDQLGAEVEVGSVTIDLWARLVLNNVYLEDQQGDTLAFIPALHVRSYAFDKPSGRLRIGSLQLDNPTIHIQRHKGEAALNYAFIVDYFSDTTAASKGDAMVNLKHVLIKNGRVRYTNQNRPIKETFGMDWNHLDFRSLDLEVNDLTSFGDTVQCQLTHMALFEKSGFELFDFQSLVSIRGGNVLLTGTQICTARTDLKGDLAFEFQSIDDFDFFEERVKMVHTFRDAAIHLGDLAYFSSDLKGCQQEIVLSGKVRGTIASLKGKNIRIQFNENSFFEGDFAMDGLPALQETFISLDIDRLTTNQIELEQIQLPPFDSLHYLATPSNFSALGQVNFAGNFTGFINDFVAFGTLNTDIGMVSSDISLRHDSATDNYFYKGNLATTAFDLGKFYGEKQLGPLTSNLEVEGSGLNLDRLDATFSGEIPAVYLNGYNYSNITADGAFRQRFFQGDIAINDPNMIMDFSGEIDFRPKDPLLRFVSNIDHLDLKQVNVLTQYPYSAVSGKVTVDSKGLELSKFEGLVMLDDVVYCTESTEYYLNHLEVQAKRTNGLTITLDSDIAEGSITGDFDVRTMHNSFLDIAGKILPSFKPPLQAHKAQKFDLALRIKDFSDIQGIFIPELNIAPNTRLQLEVDEYASNFQITLLSDSVSYENNSIKGLVLDARRPDDFLYMNLFTDHLLIGDDVLFSSFAIDTRSDKDTIYSSVVWGDTTTMHRGDLNGRFTIRDFDSFDYLTGNGFVVINNEKWSIQPGGSVRVDSTAIALDALHIRNGFQRIDAFGRLSEYEEDELTVFLRAFNLSSVNSFIGDETKLYGTLNGSASIRNVYKNSIINSDITLLDFKINEYGIGDLCLESGWDNSLKSLKVFGELEKANTVPLTFLGYYTPSNVSSPLDLWATVDQLDLAFINTFIGEDVLTMKGNATGKLKITGKPEAPNLNGDLLLANASIYVDYLHCSYKIKNKVGIRPDMFTFDYVPIEDMEGHKGTVLGQIMHTEFGKWNYDFNIDLLEPMLAMNTTEEQNPLYYGRAYATGFVNIFGVDDQIEFDMALRTEAGTSLAMPMNTTEELSLENFIRFVDSDTSKVEKPLDLSGIRLNMQLEITPQAQMEVIFDRAVGDVMKGSGRGNITMEINNLSTFNMYGSVELEKGDYLFTLKNLVNKEFVMKRGGTISWYGDPYGGELDLDAVYKVSASLYDIVPDVTTQSGQRVPVDLVMHMTGKMFNPAIAFGIELPTVDEIIRSRVNSVISTDQERNRQAFALLVLRRFVSPPNITTERTNTNTAFAENSTELLSSQISNWLSQISDDFNLGFNYRPGDEISNEEIALALSTQLFNERLSLSGNFGVSRGTSTNQNPSNVIGDVRLEYKIKMQKEKFDW
jgi:hypothetical protein